MQQFEQDHGEEHSVDADDDGSGEVTSLHLTLNENNSVPQRLEGQHNQHECNRSHGLMCMSSLTFIDLFAGRGGAIKVAYALSLAVNSRAVESACGREIAGPDPSSANRRS